MQTGVYLSESCGIEADFVFPQQHRLPHQEPIPFERPSAGLGRGDDGDKLLAQRLLVLPPV